VNAADNIVNKMRDITLCSCAENTFPIFVTYNNKALLPYSTYIILLVTIYLWPVYTTVTSF